MPHKPQIHSDYLRGPMDPAKVKKFLKDAVKLIKQYDFDAIAFRGMSGALIAPLLAYRAKKTLIMVRKPKYMEGAKDSIDHSSYRVEGDLLAKRYIILDDFTCSGETVHAIIKGVKGFAPEAVCIGVIFYQGSMNHGEPVRIQRLLGGLSYPGGTPCDPEQFRIRADLTTIKNAEVTD